MLVKGATGVRAVQGDYERALWWRHNDHDSVSNHQPHGCLLNRLFRRRSKKTSKLRVTGLCAGKSPGPVNSLHKGPVTRKMFPFDDVIMMRHVAWRAWLNWTLSYHASGSHQDGERVPQMKFQIYSAFLHWSKENQTKSGQACISSISRNFLTHWGRVTHLYASVN